jgi:Lrp/AsnC family transcriptional regulator, regulator for asnA, asnC and gidA
MFTKDKVLMTEIDAVNAKILRELLKDGRKSFAEIAKECNTSKDVIAKRYKQMKSKGIIVGATIQNSYACCSCDFIACILITTQPQEADTVLQLVHEIPQVFDVYQVGVNPSLAAMATLKTMEELDQIKQSIKQLPFVLGVDTRVWTGIRNTPENLSILPLQEIDVKTDNGRGRTPSKIDETNAKIIEKLATNGRIPFRKLAAELKISTDTVVRRYERLKENGDLKVIIQINPAKIGYYAFAIFNVAFISQGGLTDRAEALAKIPDINFIIKTSGNFDFMISVMIKDIKQLTTIQEEIASMPGVTNMEIAVAKLFDVWPLSREFISTF